MYGKVGSASYSKGVFAPARLGTEGGLALDFHGKYYEAVTAGRVFVAANQAAVALTANFAQAYTGLLVENPIGSGKNLIMLEFGYATTVATPTATAIGLMTGADAGDAAATIIPRNRLKGSAHASVAYVDNACTTTGVPVLEQIVASAWTEATTAGSLMPPHVVDLNGSLIIQPGYFVSVYSAAANTAAFIFHFMWEEVPV